MLKEHIRVDVLRKLQDLTLVCTCNDLYVDDIKAAIEDGEDEYLEIMQYNHTFPRCGECDDHVDKLVSITNQWVSFTKVTIPNLLMEKE